MLTEDEFQAQKAALLRSENVDLSRSQVENQGSGYRIDLTDEDINRDYAIRGRKSFNSTGYIAIALVFAYVMISSNIKRPDSLGEWVLAFGIVGLIYIIYEYLYDKIPVVVIPAISALIGFLLYSIFGTVFGEGLGIVAGLSGFVTTFLNGYRGSSFFNRRVRGSDDYPIDESLASDEWDMQGRSVDGKPAFWTSKWALGGAALAVFLGLSAWALIGTDNRQTSSINVVVTGPANVRDKPNTTDSQIIAKFDRGRSLVGKWVKGSDDGQERWLEFEDSGRILYIWEGNIELIDGGEKALEGSKPITSTQYPDRNAEALVSRDVGDLQLKVPQVCITNQGTRITLEREGDGILLEESEIDTDRLILVATLYKNKDGYYETSDNNEVQFDVMVTKEFVSLEDSRNNSITCQPVR